MKVKVSEKIKNLIGPKTQFIHGNQACVYGALLAGCEFYAGYPITPSTEIAEGLSNFLPRINGVFIQMEDEIASLSAVIGASLAGKRAMTATSGPGFSLMQENIGYACMVEAPCVIVDVQRSGPSTGQPTMPAQGDVMQSRWGTHGDHEIIVVSPSSVQETLDLTINAFNLADKYRVPVILLADGFVMHMREKITIPDEIEYIRHKTLLSGDMEHISELGVTRPEKVPKLNPFGDCKPGEYLTGLSHDVNGMPVTSDCEVHENLVKRLYEKIKDNVDDIVMVDERYTDDAEVLVVSFGISARPSLSAVISARKEGIKAGYLRLVTLFPHAGNHLRELSKKVDRIIVTEMNLGQVYWIVRASVCHSCRVELMPSIGGKLHNLHEIVDAIKGKGETYDVV